MSKKDKKAKKEAKKAVFPGEITVRMEGPDKWNNTPFFEMIEDREFLGDGDRIATYKLVSTGKVKLTQVIETE